MRPRWMISTREQTICTSGRMCVERITAWSRPSSRTSSRISRIWMGSRPTVGSSSTTTGGSWMMAWAMPTRCW